MRLYVTGIEQASQVRVLRALREALRAFAHDPKVIHAADAGEAHRAFLKDGYALMGQSDDPVMLGAVTRALAAEGIRATCAVTEREVQGEVDRLNGLTPEEAIAKRAPGKASPQATPASPRAALPPAAYATAMALMAMADGLPIKAAAYAFNLKHTTGSTVPWDDVLRALARTFPWAEEGMRANNFHPDPPAA